MLLTKKLTAADVLGIVKRRGWLLVIPPALTLMASLIYSASLPNVYQSNMLIAIVPQRVPDAFVKSTVTLRTEQRLDAITVQVTSRTILEQMIREFDLYPAERARVPMEDIVVRMRDSIDVQLERPRLGPRGPEPPHAFHVRFTYPDPNVATRVTQRLGSLFVDQNSRDRAALADATDQFLDAQLAQARERLEAHESRLEAFRQRHGKELPTQLTTNMQAIQSASLQIQALVESIARDRDRKLMLERLYREAGSEPAAAPALSTAVSSGGDETGTAQTAQQQLAAARALLARLELRLTPEHPDIVRTRRVIADLEPKAAAEAAGPSTGNTASAATVEDSQRRERLRVMAAEIESLDRQMRFKESEEARLRGVVGEYQRRIEAVPAIEAEWASLTRDYDTLQATYRELLNKSESSKVAVDLEKRQIGEHFRVVDAARVPVHPISPNRLQINALGLLLGLFIGVGVGALLELRDATFRSEKDVLDVVALPVLATVPYVSTEVERKKQTRVRIAVALGAVLLAVAAGVVFVSMRLWNYFV